VLKPVVRTTRWEVAIFGRERGVAYTVYVVSCAQRPAIAALGSQRRSPDAVEVFVALPQSPHVERDRVDELVARSSPFVLPVVVGGLKITAPTRE
jgi:hypothetical protein